METAPVSEDRTHYDVLGVEQTATVDQIRKRYRELAKKYHPDLNREHPEYHEVFIRITQAYETLSDTARRARYDLDLRDKQRRQADLRSGAYGSTPFTQRPAAAPGAARPGASTPPPAGARPGPTDARAQREAEQRKQSITRLMENARQAYQRGNYREAQRFCEEVLQIGRNGSAYEMLGDIYGRQARYDDAVRCYTVAAQMLPNGALIMSKLNRVLQRQGRGATGPAGDDLLRNAAQYGRTLDTQKRVGYQLAVTFFGLAGILFLMAWPIGRMEPSLGIPVAPHWTLPHLVIMSLNGLLTGAIMAAAGWLRPAGQELVYQTFGIGRLSIPMGLLLTVLGLLFLPVALLIYIPLAYRQASVSHSVLTAFGTAFALALGFTVTAQPATQLETMLFGGNVLFVSMLLGWFVGEIFRPDWAT
ncbi:MAG: molecular chaperone DnaJ [Armatimonadetes bacterium]|nr:molecular chaperone DnaJ [Armatimonadota bacterium]